MASSAISNLLGNPSSSNQSEEAKRSVTPPPPYSDNNVGKRVAPYGTWESPITFDTMMGRPEDAVLNVTSGFGPLLCDDERQVLYITAGRSSGFSTILAYNIGTGNVTELLDDTFDVRTRVHEYGGAPACLLPDGRILFSNRAGEDGVHVVDPRSKENKLVSKTANKRYADFNPHPSGKWVVTIEEDHGEEGKALPKDVVNRLVAIEIETGKVTTVREGADFYTCGRFSPDGKKLCWVQWNHPDMPWTGSELHVADWNGNVTPVSNDATIAGEAGKKSVSQPRWLSNGDLLFATDATGWSQLNRYSGGDVKPISLTGLDKLDFTNVDFGLGSQTQIELSEDKLVLSYWKEARVNVVLVDLASHTHSELNLPLTSVQVITRVSPTTIAVRGTTDTVPTTTYLLDVNQPSKLTKVQWIDDSKAPSFPTSYYSVAEHFSFPRQVGTPLPNNADTPTHALFLAPKNPNYAAPPGTLPPLIVYCHGGPTGVDPRGLALREQYWTTRGFAYAMVNYHGSSTYGRAYRTSLDTNYGILDVDDAASCALYLAKHGRVDGTRCGIVGGSSGGYCVLQAMTRFPAVWAGGISLFGISKVKDLMEDTHKFESRYLDKLCFRDGMSEEEKWKLLDDRSPYYHAKNITAPVLLLQGLEDKVVPPAQAREMEKVIRENGGDVRLVLYEGEGHGFVQRKNQESSNDEQERWWMKTLVRLEKGEKQ